ncbi:hypothetical protein [Corynebacterium sp.]|uniref:hypothetical protein n=1 Tax=Corynebacterium sp. TaxID=1720 RepID=UPI0026DD70A5|nr:hypothetical protein [Corynebacterium sp.]MDO5032789.1 hypothetical protein [Corynebacterium sp.]
MDLPLTSLVGVVLEKTRPPRPKMRSRKKLPHIEARTVDIAPIEGPQLRMTVRELLVFAAEEHQAGIVLDGKSFSPENVAEAAPAAREAIDRDRQWCVGRFGLATPEDILPFEGEAYPQHSYDLPEFVIRCCGERVEVSGDISAETVTEFLDRRTADGVRGAWLSLHGVNGPNMFVLTPNFMHRPAWSAQPTPAEWAAELERHPRSAQWIPDWLAAQLRLAEEEK